MKAARVTINNTGHRTISEEDYMALLRDITDLKKVFKRLSEKGTEARSFFKNVESRSRFDS